MSPIAAILPKFAFGLQPMQRFALLSDFEPQLGQQFVQSADAGFQNVGAKPLLSSAGLQPMQKFVRSAGAGFRNVLVEPLPVPSLPLSVLPEYVRKVFLHAWKEAINKPLPRPTT